MPSMSHASSAPTAGTSEPDVASTNEAMLPAVVTDRLPAPERVTLGEAMPGIEDLFLFAREAELRVRSLRLVIQEQTLTSRADEARRHELWLEHPGRARITIYRDDAMPARDYDAWILDGGVVTTYLAARKVASRRPLQRHVVGVDDASLPPFARQREPLTALQPGSLVDTFVHPHGLFRNVLVTGPLAVTGSRAVGEREAIIVRAEHPRASKVLVDRPDRSIEVGIDRQTGFLVLYSEWIGDTVTRHAEVTELSVDPVISASVFELRLPQDTRMLY
jgi:hypothetical protein